MRKFLVGSFCSFVFLTAFSQEIPIRVPSDAKATYFVLELSKKGNSRTIVTKRVGPSGTSFSKRLFNCNNGSVKYLGTGDTLSAMNASTPEKSMSPVVEGSIPSYIGGYACSK